MAAKKTRQQRELYRVLKKGAKWGAGIGALLGFMTGIYVCFRYHVPIPPLAGSEVGIFLGLSIGLPVSLVCRTRAGRVTLASTLAGALLGIPVALWHGHFQPLTWLGVWTLVTFLGYQSAVMPQRAADPWRLH